MPGFVPVIAAPWVGDELTVQRPRAGDCVRREIRAPDVTGSSIIVRGRAGGDDLRRECVPGHGRGQGVGRRSRHIGEGVNTVGVRGGRIDSAAGARGGNGRSADGRSGAVGDPPADDLAAAVRIDVVNTEGDDLPVVTAGVEVREVVPGSVVAGPAQVQMVIKRGGIVSVSIGDDLVAGAVGGVRWTAGTEIPRRGSG